MIATKAGTLPADFDYEKEPLSSLSLLMHSKISSYSKRFTFSSGQECPKIHQSTYSTCCRVYDMRVFIVFV